MELIRAGSRSLAGPTAARPTICIKDVFFTTVSSIKMFWQPGPPAWPTKDSPALLIVFHQLQHAQCPTDWYIK